MAKDTNMKRGIEHKIGTRITLKVVKQDGCEGCFFSEFDNCREIACSCFERMDDEKIIYKVIEEE